MSSDHESRMCARLYTCAHCHCEKQNSYQTKEYAGLGQCLCLSTCTKCYTLLHGTINGLGCCKPARPKRTQSRNSQISTDSAARVRG